MRQQSKSRYVLAFATTALATLMASAVQAAIDIPRVPLQSGTAVPPNIMFVIDDSGSMHGEIMPDGLIFRARQTNDRCRFWNGSQYVYYYCDQIGLNVGLVYPRADDVYGDDDYTNVVANVESGSGYGAMVRSPSFNKIYYNPAITYQPWSNADGSLRANASTTCALHNPENVGTGAEYCRDLTVDNGNYNSNYWQDYGAICASTAEACFADQEDLKFWPAAYFRYDGSGDATSASSYTKVEIRPAVGSYTGDGRASRTDCVAGTCTYAQEIQNFANWYQYYRSRILLARAGIGRAFSGLSTTSTAASPAPRVGFGAINKDSSSVDGTSTETIVSGVRPFVGADRTAFFTSLYGRDIPAAGTPLRRALDDAGKYFQRGDNSGPWAAVPGGSDTTAHLACRQSYSILMTDGYWNGDAASSPANANNDGTSGSEITRPAGSSYTYSPVSPFTDGYSDTLADVAMYYWRTDLRSTIENKVPTTTANPAFWQHMVTYGVGLGVTGAVDPEDAFAAIGDTTTTITWPDPSASAAAKIDDLLHAGLNSRGGFFSAADPVEFAQGLSRVLVAINERTASGSNVAANSVALKEETRIFQASFVAGKWTGELASYAISAAGVAPNPEWRGSQGIPAFGTRKVFTWSGTAGADFPTTAQNTALGTNIANYIKGDTSNERRNGGTLRNRDHLLGDIINSSPAFVKETNTIFIGANDGMLHAFSATGTNMGDELFAFIPNATSTASLDKLKTLADPDYAHDYFVDGPVMVSSHVETPGKNYLVGSLGRGGKGVYFLDVTNPNTFGTSNVTGQYLGTNGGNANTASDHMGNSLGRPLIANVLLGTGNNKVKTPVAIVSNGINSSTGDPTLFVFNLQTGALLRHIVAKADSDNGLSSPRGWDLDGDGLIDYVYAGDLKGNIWKFDLSDNSTNGWGLHAEGDPFFVATDAAGNGQPITGGLSVSMDPSTFKPWVFFGTGKYLESGDLTSTAVQSLYGIKDNDAAVGARATDLQARTMAVTSGTIDGKPVRAFQANAPLPADKKGWFVDLTVLPPAERMVGDPFLLGNVLVAASIIPSSDPCDAGGTGYINALDAYTGTSVQNPFFDVDGDGAFDDDRLTSGQDSLPVGSVNLGIAMPTSPTVVESLLVAGGSLGTTGSVAVNNPLVKGRISWRELIKD
ncbi:pilus assembly protein [Arenimonas soli]|nr:PilC/PilY family type IV pilus protein [Arenimonas soli]